MSYFEQLGLAEPILRALGTKGYSDPTPIQQQAIPALMEGRDLLGIAQTGTGKTAAFSLPSLHRLINNPVARKPASCRMLVLSPTRELAAQIAENIRGYAKYLSINVQCIFGGVPVGKQARALVPGTDILVATPGRLLDLIEQRALTLRNVEIFVLDEADQMMDLGFIKPLTQIAKMLPSERQSLFFSATMPQSIAELGKRFINNPVKVSVAPQATTAERVEQYATYVNQAEKQALLTLRLRETMASEALDRALVFTRTKHGADRVTKHLVAAGIGAAAIHGNKSQGQRTAALQGFRTGAIRVLVATDIAARGIDVTGVSHVFNFELPNVAEQYVHRIGRTARAGADGIAMSFVAPDEKAYLRDIEKLTRIKLTELPLPEDFVVEARRLPLPSKKAVEEAVHGDAGRGRQGRGAGRPGTGRDGQQRGGRGGERTNDRGGEGRPQAAHGRNRDEAPRHGEPRRDAPHRDAPRRDERGPRVATAHVRDEAPRANGERRPIAIEISGQRPAWVNRAQDVRQGQAPREDRGHRSDQNGQRNVGGRHGESRNGDGRHQGQGRPGFDPLKAYADAAQSTGVEPAPVPKRLREGGQLHTAPRPEGGRNDGSPRPNKPHGQRRFGNGGGRPQGGQGGGRRSGAGRAG